MQFEYTCPYCGTKGHLEGEFIHDVIPIGFLERNTKALVAGSDFRINCPCGEKPVFHLSTSGQLLLIDWERE